MQELNTCPLIIMTHALFIVFATNLAKLTAWSLWDMCLRFTHSPSLQMCETSILRSSFPWYAMYAARWVPRVWLTPWNLLRCIHTFHLELFCIRPYPSTLHCEMQLILFNVCVCVVLQRIHQVIESLWACLFNLQYFGKDQIRLTIN